LGTAARARADAQFGIDRIVSETLHLYSRMK
jgi:hypothetical protein